MTAFIKGERCSLRPLTRDDIDHGWADWFNDPDVTRHMLRGVFPIHHEEQVAFYEQVAGGGQSDLVLAIVTPDGTHVGTTGLHRIDWVNRHAEFGIVIGDEQARGQGIGTEATRLICSHGFSHLNLHRIWLGVFADHAAAIRSYEKVGFRAEGTMREEILRDGSYHDKLVMGVLAGELRLSD
jgi:RimJ/RimL family protein N-acetyltransferase